MIRSVGSDRMATPGADKAGIPYCSDEHILHLKKEYEHKTINESDPALEACFKCVSCSVLVEFLQ